MRRNKAGLSQISCDPIARATTTKRQIDVYVGARLRNLRQASGLDLAAVSREVAIPGAVIAQYESGERRPSSGDLVALARLYGVALYELFPQDPSQITGQFH